MREHKLNNMRKGSAWIIAIVSIVVVIALVLILVFTLNGKEDKEPIPFNPVCGDGNCSISEGCYTCPEDCKCNENNYCSETEDSCVGPVCGNGVCESFESWDNCCEDCECIVDGEICDNETHSCHMPDFGLEKSEVESIVRSYYASQGRTILNLTISGIMFWEGAYGMPADVLVDNETNLEYILVREDGSIEILPFF